MIKIRYFVKVTNLFYLFICSLINPFYKYLQDTFHLYITRDTGLFSGSERSPEEENGNPH